MVCPASVHFLTHIANAVFLQIRPQMKIINVQYSKENTWSLLRLMFSFKWDRFQKNLWSSFETRAILIVDVTDLRTCLVLTTSLTGHATFTVRFWQNGNVINKNINNSYFIWLEGRKIVPLFYPDTSMYGIYGRIYGGSDRPIHGIYVCIYRISDTEMSPRCV